MSRVQGTGLDERCPDCGLPVAYTACAGHPYDRYDDYDPDPADDGGDEDE